MIDAQWVMDMLSRRVTRRQQEVEVCWSARSKKHMQIRADELGQALKEIRAEIRKIKENA